MVSASCKSCKLYIAACRAIEKLCTANLNGIVERLRDWIAMQQNDYILSVIDNCPIVIHCHSNLVDLSLPLLRDQCSCLAKNRSICLGSFCWWGQVKWSIQSLQSPSIKSLPWRYTIHDQESVIRALSRPKVIISMWSRAFEQHALYATLCEWAAMHMPATS